MKQAALLLGSRGSDILGHFRSKSDQGGLLCRVVRHLSSQLTKLSGDFGREKCRDPLSRHLSWYSMRALITGPETRCGVKLHPEVMASLLIKGNDLTLFVLYLGELYNMNETRFPPSVRFVR